MIRADVVDRRLGEAWRLWFAAAGMLARHPFSHHFVRPAARQRRPPGPAPGG